MHRLYFTYILYHKFFIFSIKKLYGADGEARTLDPLIKSQLRYHCATSADIKRLVLTLGASLQGSDLTLKFLNDIAILSIATTQ